MIDLRPAQASTICYCTSSGSSSGSFLFLASNTHLNQERLKRRCWYHRNPTRLWAKIGEVMSYRNVFQKREQDSAVADKGNKQSVAHYFLE